MADSPFPPLGLTSVINASGKMTALGGSAQTESVAAALEAGAKYHVEMSELRRVAGLQVAARSGAEAGSITSGAAAGIAIGVAAMICDDDPARVSEIPNPSTARRDILLVPEHDVNFGAPIEQMVRLGGGFPRFIAREEMAGSISANTAGLLYVQSHHTRGDSVELADLVEIARAAKLPLLVDAAAEEDLQTYITQGADLVTYSGGKAIGGPTIGFIVGGAHWVGLCELQNRGIARPMKVGKEQIVAFLAALAAYPSPQPESVIGALQAGLSRLPGLRVSLIEDRAGRDITRIGILRSDVGWLQALAEYLRVGEPAIYTRTHEVEEGHLLFDVRELSMDQVALIVTKVGRFLQDAEAP